MGTMDQGTLREWLDLEVEGELDERERHELLRQLEDDAPLAAERREPERLGGMLRESRVPVRPGFAREVVRSLPAAGWEAKSPKRWRLVAALLVLLGGASAALVGTGSARLAPQSAFVGAVSAVADLFQAAALTGAGMLSASWKGLGLAMGELMRGSWLNWVAFGLVVLGLNALLVLQLRAHRHSAVAARERERGNPR